AAAEILPHLDAATTAPHTRVVIDLTRVEFFDCSGLRLLYRARRRVLDGQGDLRLVCAHPLTLRMLRITGLSRLLPPRPARDAALERPETATGPLCRPPPPPRGPRPARAPAPCRAPGLCAPACSPRSARPSTRLYATAHEGHADRRKEGRHHDDSDRTPPPAGPGLGQGAGGRRPAPRRTLRRPPAEPAAGAQGPVRHRDPGPVRP